jgi:hypothetical protein
MRKPHGTPDESHVETLVVLASPAIPAFVAWPAGIHGNPQARGDARHLTSNLVNGAGNLVPERHRLLQPDGAEAAVIVVVQVRPANAAGLDPNPDIAGPKGCGCYFFNAKVFGSMDDNAAHGFSSCCRT